MKKEYTFYIFLLTSTDRANRLFVAHPPSLCFASSILAGFSIFISYTMIAKGDSYE